MRVIQLVSEAGWRGGEQQIAYLIDELQRKGVVSVAIVKAKSSFEKYCIEKEIPFYSLPFLNSMDVYTAFQIKRIARKEKADLVHAHSSRSHSMAFLATLLGMFIPLIVSRRVMFKIGDGFFSTWKYNHPAIKKIITVSNLISSLVEDKLKDVSKCEVIYDGIDLDRFIDRPSFNLLREEYKIGESSILVGNISALSADKDLITYINSIAILKQQKLPIKAFIIGKGIDEEKLKEYVTSNDLKDTVIFTGFRKNINELLPCLDIFMLTSIAEGLGTSILDAFAAGVPVVATRTGGIPEIVIDGETGLLAEPKDAKGLAENITQLIQSEELRNKLVTNASLKVKTFSKEIMAEKTYNVYKEILNS